MTTLDAAQPARSLSQKLRLAAADIKLAHSVFALPFAVLGVALAAPRDGSGDLLWPRVAAMLLLVVACMFLARTWAMLVNRVIDRRFDRENPRTRDRAFAAGRLSPRDGVWLLAASAAGLVASAAIFAVWDNWWPLIGSPVVLAWLAFYSWTKRFTALCHLVLGSALALSPIAAAIAVGGPEAVTLHTDPDRGLNGLALWALAGMVALWVAGFDVIYALADLEFDRARGLRSIPARLGWSGAVWVSRGLHVLAVLMLLLAWRAADVWGWAFGVGVLLTASLLVVEHAVLATRGKAGIPIAFFTLNGLVAILLGLLGAIDALAL